MAALQRCWPFCPPHERIPFSPCPALGYVGGLPRRGMMLFQRHFSSSSASALEPACLHPDLAEALLWKKPPSQESAERVEWHHQDEGIDISSHRDGSSAPPPPNAPGSAAPTRAVASLGGGTIFDSQPCCFKSSAPGQLYRHSLQQRI